jgi:hypothetical protein
MLEAIPIEASFAAILGGAGVVAAAVVAGFLLARREVKRVDPNDVPR